MGRLEAIAVRSATKVPMKALDEAQVRVASGVADDFRGRPGDRQVTVLSAEAWRDACEAVGVDLPWTHRRANLLVTGVALAYTKGARLVVGDAVLEVTGETDPCRVMDLQHAGLRAALEPDWRGGVICRVVEDGHVRIGDDVRLEPVGTEGGAA